MWTFYVYAIVPGTVVVFLSNIWGKFKKNSVTFSRKHKESAVGMNDAFFLIFQGKSHDVAVRNLFQLYWPILKANWSYLSLLVFINIKFVPPIVSYLTRWRRPRSLGYLRMNFLLKCLIHPPPSPPSVVPCSSRQLSWLRLGNFLDQQTTQATKSTGRSRPHSICRHRGWIRRLGLEQKEVTRQRQVKWLQFYVRRAHSTMFEGKIRVSYHFFKFCLKKSAHITHHVY